MNSLPPEATLPACPAKLTSTALLCIASLARKACASLNSLSFRLLHLAIRARQAADPEGEAETPPPGTINKDSTIQELQDIAIRCGASNLEFHTDRIVAIFQLKPALEPPFTYSIRPNPTPHSVAAT